MHIGADTNLCSHFFLEPTQTSSDLILQEVAHVPGGHMKLKQISETLQSLSQLNSKQSPRGSH